MIFRNISVFCFDYNKIHGWVNLVRIFSWAMVHKLRKDVENRDARCMLGGMVEFDEGYFVVETSELEKGKRQEVEEP